MKFRIYLIASIMLSTWMQVQCITKEQVENIASPLAGIATAAVIGGLVGHWHMYGVRMPSLKDKHQTECITIAAMLFAAWGSYASIKLSSAAADKKNHETSTETAKRLVFKTGSYITAAGVLIAAFTSGLMGWVLHTHATIY